MGSKKDKKVPAGRIDRDPPRKAVPANAARAAQLIVPPTGRLIVRWTKFDFDGPWCLSASDAAVIVAMMQKIQQIETMTPAEVFAPRDHALGADYGAPHRLPCAEAFDRLKELRLEDETNISRIGINGKQRLYGFRRDPEFYAIFWDPEHKIWPSKLKHT